MWVLLVAWDQTYTSYHGVFLGVEPHHGGICNTKKVRMKLKKGRFSLVNWETIRKFFAMLRTNGILFILRLLLLEKEEENWLCSMCKKGKPMPLLIIRLWVSEQGLLEAKLLGLIFTW